MLTKEQEHMLSILEVTEYLPGFVFGQSVNPEIVSSDREYPVLVELREMGRAELVHGRGWRAVAVPGVPTSQFPERAEAFEKWKAEVANGLTILGFEQWVPLREILEDARRDGH